MSSTINLAPFPNNVGTILQYQLFDQSTLVQLPLKTIIRLYGTVGSGKGTLAKNLMSSLELTNLETSFILRSCTWIYQQLGLEFNDTNTDIVYSQLEIKMNNRALQFFWKSQELTNAQLRSTIVDQNVSIYSGNPHFRSNYYNKINFILDNLVSTPVILDGRGSNTPYLNQAELSGYKVIRLFLWVNPEVSYQRFLSRLSVVANSVSNSSNEQELKDNFIKNVLNRDNQDYSNIVSNNLGTISADTGIIDTSDLTPDQVLEVALGFITSQK